MASQQILFAETIAGMKKAFKRKAYDSDSDSEIENYSNRGKKLKKRSRFAHKGQLIPTTGPSAYKEYVEYAGFERPIIHRNPPLIDDEGYELDSDDDDGRLRDAGAAAAELNPYSNIRIQHILAPLTSSTALPTHTTLSKPFISKTLTRLVDQSCDITRKENRSLWQVRHLLTALCGDFTWVPCNTLVKPTDIELYTDDHVAQHLLSLSKGLAAINGGAPSPATLVGDAPQQNGNANQQAGPNIGKPEGGDPDVSMADADASEQMISKQNGKTDEEHGKDDYSTHSKEKTASGAKETSQTVGAAGNARNESQSGGKLEVNSKGVNDETADTGHSAGTALTGVSGGVLDLVERTDGQGSSLGSDILDQTFVHPMFIAPVGAKPDRDVGIPDQEAEDIRRLLALYVQKQEEVCRGARKLYLGLLKAEKLRHDVLHWSKAEAHSGANRDMSDGEDWYDKEEWGLTEDLKKGQDEEEEDTQTTGKKTRNRR